MTPVQRTRLAQGIVFGLFFYFLGSFIKDVVVRYTPAYYGGWAGIVMGFIIFSWGWSHLLRADNLPKWGRPVGAVAFLLIFIWWWWS